MKKTLVFLSFILLILGLFSLVFWFYEVRFFVGRASVSQQSFSVENSYLFVAPLRAKANEKEKIRVTVFVLNNQGLGVAGKKVFIGRDQNLYIDEIQALTDNFGKAVFDIASSK
ncbi:MAG: hypothetical protein ACPL1D_01985, partial [Microgenomates group bacterium]